MINYIIIFTESKRKFQKNLARKKAAAPGGGGVKHRLGLFSDQ